MTKEQKTEKKQPDNGSYQHDRIKRVLRILTTLKRFSDENHPVTQMKIREQIEKEWGEEFAGMNPQSLSRILKEMIEEMNTKHYVINNARSYENVMIKPQSETGKRMGRLIFNHPFSYKELDTVIDAVLSFDDIMDSEKKDLVIKLANLSSDYYKAKWVNADNRVTSEVRKDEFRGVLNNAQKAIRETHFYDQNEVVRNMKLIRKALERKPMRRKISFFYAIYNASAQLAVKRDKDNKPKKYVVTPYRIIKYNGRPYMVCCKDGEVEAGIYRVDLMVNINVLEDQRGIPESQVKNLHKDWLEKGSMSQRLNMHYGDAVEVTMEVPAGNYTFVHDWFGDNYRVAIEYNGKAQVKVRTNPRAMADWAMQYSDIVTVLGPKEVTDMIKEKLTSACERYKC